MALGVDPIAVRTAAKIAAAPAICLGVKFSTPVAFA
jgi:hypothetical protein